VVNALDRAFANLIESLKELVGKVNTDQLYGRVGDTSFGEQILRSAAVIEQTFGGLTANLWDDPFEWTLPETLSTPDRVIDHLSEIDALRQRVFQSIDGDAALNKYVSVPSGEPCALVELLLGTLVRASDYRGRAGATLKILSSEATPRFII
jgi:hypothetical protein